MKAYIIILLLGISLSYNPRAAIEYANKYCSNYNKIFYNYNSENDGRDSANFVSQCLHEGGQSFEGCNGVDLKGMIPRVSELKACLVSKGWKSSGSMPSSGMPKGSVITYYNGGHVAIVVEGGKYPKIAAHTTDVYGRGYDYASGRHYYWP